jgi:hypothetical protein
MKVARVPTLFLPELTGKIRHPAGTNVALLENACFPAYSAHNVNFRGILVETIEYVENSLGCHDRKCAEQ